MSTSSTQSEITVQPPMPLASTNKKPSKKKRTEHNVQLAVSQPGADPLSFLDQTTSLLTQFVPPDHDYWAGLTPEDREKEISVLWHKDQLAALRVIAAPLLQFEYACNILPVYAPMLRKIREQAKINARPTAGQKQYMWKDIGIDREGPITWTSICEVIFRRCIQHVNRCIADTKKIMPLLTDGNQNDDGTLKSHKPKLSAATPSKTDSVARAAEVTVKTPLQLFRAVEVALINELENVFMVEQDSDFLRNVKEFAQVIADNFKPTGMRVVVEVRMEKEEESD